MNTKKEFLKSLSIFSSLSDAEINRLAEVTEEFTYKNGDYIFYEGDSPNWLCMVKEGNVKAITARVKKRIASTLIKLANIDPAEDMDECRKNIDLPLTRKDIANMVGTTIETAIRVMSKFQKEGIIESAKGRITILKPAMLIEKAQ